MVNGSSNMSTVNEAFSYDRGLWDVFRC
jgi:hypothetical protein